MFMSSLFSRLSDLLARLVPRLTFDEPLESEFRRWYAEHTRSRVRSAMWIAMGNMLVVMLAGGPFREMRSAIFGPENQPIVDLLRFGFIVPSSIAMLVVSYTALYRRWFGFTAQIRRRGEDAQKIKRQTGYEARRWVVERVHR